MSRWASSLALALTGVTMLVCAATTDLWLVQLVVFLTGRFCATFAMNVSRYTGRYIYTYLQSTPGGGRCQTCAGRGAGTWPWCWREWCSCWAGTPTPASGEPEPVQRVLYVDNIYTRIYFLDNIYTHIYCRYDSESGSWVESSRLPRPLSGHGACVVTWSPADTNHIY